MKRINYIDAMRAFAIFLVVYAHVLYISYDAVHVKSIHDVFINFFMPLFFFISGFLTYKDKHREICELPGFAFNKFKLLIIPPLVFGTLYALVTDRGVYDMLYIESKSGYWYTEVLFFYLIFYYIICAISDRYKKHSFIMQPLFAVFIYALSIYTQHHYASDKFISILSIQRWYYYIFFVFGVFVKKYYNYFEQYSKGSILNTSIVLLFFVFVFFQDNFYEIINIPLKGTIIQIPYTLSCIAVVFMFFYYHRDYFEKQQGIPSFMKFIGRRTMDIYMLHFFFLPLGLECVANKLNNYNSIVIEFFTTSTIVCCVIFFSIAAGSIIRISPFLAHILFGEKIQENKTQQLT